jgi:hypothetical protein
MSTCPARCVEQVLGQGRGLAPPALEGLAALLAHLAVGVLALGQEQEAHLAAVLQHRQGVLQGAPGGLAAGAVAVEAEHHLGHGAEQPVQVFAGGGGAQGGHGVADAELGQGHHVHVALHHQQAFQLAFRLARLEQAVQLLALVEHGAFRAVEVLGLVVAQHPAAEADHPAAAVADGEHDPVAEAVVGAAVVTGQGQAQ